MTRCQYDGCEGRVTVFKREAGAMLYACPSHASEGWKLVDSEEHVRTLLEVEAEDAKRTGAP